MWRGFCSFAVGGPQTLLLAPAASAEGGVLSPVSHAVHKVKTYSVLR